MATMGRPLKPFDFPTFERLCRLQCTLEEVAGFMEVSADTVERRCKSHYGTTFADAYKKYSAPGRISLRRHQFRQAKTSAAMAIWLGKQYLGQSDKIETKAEVRSYVSPEAQAEMLADDEAVDLACRLEERLSGGGCN
jgi:hypothetical protein